MAGVSGKPLPLCRSTSAMHPKQLHLQNQWASHFGVHLVELRQQLLQDFIDHRPNRAVTDDPCALTLDSL